MPVTARGRIFVAQVKIDDYSCAPVLKQNLKQKRYYGGRVRLTVWALFTLWCFYPRSIRKSKNFQNSPIWFSRCEIMYDLPKGKKDGQRSHIRFASITSSRTELQIQSPKTSKKQFCVFCIWWWIIESSSWRFTVVPYAGEECFRGAVDVDRGHARTI